MSSRTLTRLRWPLLGAGAAALVLGAATGLAGSGVGSVFSLGKKNAVNKNSTLIGKTSAPQLIVRNKGGGPALSLISKKGVPALKVSNDTKIGSLNADKLDGLDASSFLSATGTAVNADKLDNLDSTNFLSGTGTAVNADNLDGLDSTAFWKLGGNTATSPGTHFLGTTDNQALELKVNGQRVLRVEPTATTAVCTGATVTFCPNVIGGFPTNSVTAGIVGATIAGGGDANIADGPNTVTADYGTVGGGHGNTSGDEATVAGGESNVASGGESFVGGGDTNTASGGDATISGGEFNTASGVVTTIGGGINNVAVSIGATVGGGSGNTANSSYATVPGGFSNTASGDYAFAAGREARATNQGSFVWGDSKDFLIGSNGVDTFTARSTGGARFISAVNSTTGATTAGVSLAAGGGSWASLSDLNAKERFRRVDKQWLLRRLAGVPIRRWSYKSQSPYIRHLGPTAQDFHRAFGLGEDKRHITTVDADGVALTAIQALYRQNRLLQARLARVEQRLRRLSPRGR